MSEALAKIEEVAARARAELEAVGGPDQLEQFRIRYLGSNGEVKNLMQLLKTAPPDQKKAVGQRANAVKDELSGAFEARKQQISAGAADSRDTIDVTEPGLRPRIGNRHIVNKVIDELTELFARMGFSVAAGPEVEDEFHNFIALNIPPQHPARDPLDNFYLTPDRPGARAASNVPEGQQLLLRTQTSTVQIRVMENQKPPIRVVIPGRVYRPDTIDRTHLPMFTQLEALVVDKNVTMVDLKSTVMQFIRAYIGEHAKVRFRPSFFPFTEPSAEADVWVEGRQKWVELGGCGMVHPNVFKACGIDPEVYSGWAFGFGIERIAMSKYGVNDDWGIRHFVDNDLRFLRQF